MPHLSERTRSAPRPPAQGEGRRPSPSDLALVCGLMAVAAAAGTVGLVGGGIDMGPEVTGRFPGHSPVLAGSALAVVVALPMAVAALAGARRSPRSADVAVLAGGCLIVWIPVQVAVIRTFSWLQPACLLYGSVVVALGLLAGHAGRPGRPTG